MNGTNGNLGVRFNVPAGGEEGGMVSFSGLSQHYLGGRGVE